MNDRSSSRLPRGGWLAALAVAATLLLAAPAAAASVSLPSKPTSGLGSDGPCGTSATSRLNPADITQKIVVYSPTGTAATPVTGGKCNDAKRPVVVVVHGLLAGIDTQLLGMTALYSDVVNHLVSAGNVVVFATYDTNPNDFAGSFQKENAAVALAPKYAPRGDFSRLGIVGHSMGGGAVPYLAQQAVTRGWGAQALWLFALAPAFTANVGTGAIQLPGHARVVVEGYDNDNFVDMRLGIDQFNAYSVPASQKKHLTVRSQTRGNVTMDASHLSPNSLLAPDGPIHFFAIDRVADALESCSLNGANCDTDLSYMGQWSDGQPVTPAIVSTSPVDAGPEANALSIVGLSGECESAINPRAAVCPPSSL